MKAHIFFALLFFPVLLYSQPEYLTIIQDTGIDKALKLYREFATEKRAVSGFRIQLGSNSNRATIMDIKSRFTAMYPEITTYVVYQQPQFKLRVGDFAKRTEANKFIEELKPMFSTAFIVPDKIYLKGIPW